MMPNRQHYLADACIKGTFASENEITSTRFKNRNNANYTNCTRIYGWDCGASVIYR